METPSSKGLNGVAWKELEHDVDCRGGGYHMGERSCCLSHALKEDLAQEPLCDTGT